VLDNTGGLTTKANSVLGHVALGHVAHCQSLLC
jgi:hypothetical protein